MSITDNKRLAKNTLILYGRTFLIMIIGLFTSRVILKTLGVDNYGIYNVVGGFVSMFTIIGGTLVSATQRFLSFELGRQKNSNIRNVFSASLTINVALSLILLLLFETFGLWFLNVKLNIPIERMSAANWVYQCSIIVFLINILCTPYNALIIAHERMSAFAYISLLEVTLNLAIAYILSYLSYDKLIVYALLMLTVAISIRLCYVFYCKRNFFESSLVIVKDLAIYKRIASFASMTFIGSVASILASQGVNIIMNMFCGVVVNAARGLATQVEHAVTKFTTDFMTALNPQITKSYASGDFSLCMSLCYRGAKLSFFLLLIIVTPICFRTDYILKLWLESYPDYTMIFLRLTLILALLSVLSRPVTTVILAIGQLRSFVLLIGGVRLLILPLCYITLELGFEPHYCYIVLIGMEVVSLYIRLSVVKNLANWSISTFFYKVIKYVLVVSILVFLSSYFFDISFSDDFLGFVCFLFASIMSSLAITFWIGLVSEERNGVLMFVKNKIIKR